MQINLLTRYACDVAPLLSAAGGPGGQGLHRPGADEAGRSRQARPWAALRFDDQVDVEAGVAAGFATVLERARAAGVELHPLRLDDHDYARLRRASLLVCEVEGAIEHEAALAGGAEGVSAELRALFDWGADSSPVRLARAYRDLSEAGAAVRLALSPFAGLLSPATPQAAFAFRHPVPADQADFCLIGSLAGLPATALPAGVDPQGLPVSVQALGWTDASTLGLAQRLSLNTVTPEAFRA